MTEAEKLKAELNETPKLQALKPQILEHVRQGIRRFGQSSLYQHGSNHIYDPETGHFNKHVHILAELPQLISYLRKEGFHVNTQFNSHAVAYYSISL